MCFNSMYSGGDFIVFIVHRLFHIYILILIMWIYGILLLIFYLSEMTK